jgi:transcriptional regulator with XRE-family HTH domain
VLAGRELDSPGERRRDDVTMIEDAWRGQMNALGGFIRTQRNLAQLSLRELASLTDLSNAYLSQVERGVHEPSVRVLKAGLLDEARTEAGAGDVARTEAAIRSDPALTEDQMEALLAVYRSYSGQGAAE